MHNYDGALVEYKKAADLAPQQPGTHEHMGNTFWVTGKWESAETEFKAELANQSQQLHGEMEAGECHARSEWLNRGRSVRFEPSHRALPETHAGACRPCPGADQVGAAEGSAARPSDGRKRQPERAIDSLSVISGL